MKKLFSIIILTLVFCCSSSKNNENNDSDCINSEYEFICWTIVDDTTGNPIANASISLIWNSGFGSLISGDTTNEGLICFCWNISSDVISGGISAEGYKWLDLTGIIPSDISSIRLTSSN